MGILVNMQGCIRVFEWSFLDWATQLEFNRAN